MDDKNIENLQARTESKLRYAEIHLNELKEQESLGGTDFERAHQESFLFHLLGARDSFLLELNEYYRLHLKEWKVSDKSLKDELKKLGKSIPEFDRILEMQGDNSNWLHHAKAMRNQSMHVSSVSRIYNEGGVNHEQVWLKIPKTEKNIERHFIDEFIDWLQNMKVLLKDLRENAIMNNR